MLYRIIPLRSASALSRTFLSELFLQCRIHSIQTRLSLSLLVRSSSGCLSLSAKTGKLLFCSKLQCPADCTYCNCGSPLNVLVHSRAWMIGVTILRERRHYKENNQLSSSICNSILNFKFPGFSSVS